MVLGAATVIRPARRVATAVRGLAAVDGHADSAEVRDTVDGLPTLAVAGYYGDSADPVADGLPTQAVAAADPVEAGTVKEESVDAAASAGAHAAARADPVEADVVKEESEPMSPCSEESVFPIGEDEHSAEHDPDRCTPQAEPDAGLMPTADSAASGSDAGLMPTSDPFWPTAPVRRWQMPVRPSGSVPSTASGSGGLRSKSWALLDAGPTPPWRRSRVPPSASAEGRPDSLELAQLTVIQAAADLEQLGERPAADRPGPYASADRPRLRAVGTAANPAAVPKAGPWKASVPLGADRAPLILPPGAGHEPVLMAPPRLVEVTRRDDRSWISCAATLRAGTTVRTLPAPAALCTARIANARSTGTFPSGVSPG